MFSQVVRCSPLVAYVANVASTMLWFSCLPTMSLAGPLYMVWSCPGLPTCSIIWMRDWWPGDQRLQIWFTPCWTLEPRIRTCLSSKFFCCTGVFYCLCSFPNFIYWVCFVFLGFIRWTLSRIGSGHIHKLWERNLVRSTWCCSLRRWCSGPGRLCTVLSNWWQRLSLPMPSDRVSQLTWFTRPPDDFGDYVNLSD